MAKKPEVTEEAAAVEAPPIELREATFMIPLTQGDLPVPIDTMHQQVTFQLAARFGGCYGTPVNGAWRTPAGEDGMGMVMVEPMLLVTVAIGPEDEADFRDYAIAAARAFKQEALYWTDRAGVAHIVPVTAGRVH